jgi:hypothetical protein
MASLVLPVRTTLTKQAPWRCSALRAPRRKAQAMPCRIPCQLLLRHQVIAQQETEVGSQTWVFEVQRSSPGPRVRHGRIQETSKPKRRCLDPAMAGHYSS